MPRSFPPRSGLVLRPERRIVATYAFGSISTNRPGFPPKPSIRGQGSSVHISTDHALCASSDPKDARSRRPYCYFDHCNHPPLSAAHRRSTKTCPVQPLDNRHDVALILCRRTLRPRHDAFFSLPRLYHRSVPRCFSRWSHSSPRRVYPTHGGPAEQSAWRSQSSASVGVIALVVLRRDPPCPTPD